MKSSKGGTMKRSESELREPRAPEGPEMITLMRRGVTEALREHKNEGRSIIAWDRGSQQIIEIPASEIVIPDEAVDGGSV
jgi:hypothetical protein